jgi:hypothetical protein
MKNPYSTGTISCQKINRQEMRAQEQLKWLDELKVRRIILDNSKNFLNYNGQKPFVHI